MNPFFKGMTFFAAMSFWSMVWSLNILPFLTRRFFLPFTSFYQWQADMPAAFLFTSR
jgi:hypothetical protein